MDGTGSDSQGGAIRLSGSGSSVNATSCTFGPNMAVRGGCLYSTTGASEPK